MYILGAKSLRVAIIGMPRSGSTIVAAYLNSLDNTLIVGEPHLAALMPRPGENLWPSIVETPYGILQLNIDSDVFSAIKGLVHGKDVNVLGFKECWTPWTDPIEIVESLEQELEIILVVIREPRKNYMSLCQRTPEGHKPLDPDKFVEEYVKLVNYARDQQKKAFPIYLDYFRIDPKMEIEDATNWELLGEHSFTEYFGGGDQTGRTSLAVRRIDNRPPYLSSNISGAVEAYERLITPEILWRIRTEKRLFI